MVHPPAVVFSISVDMHVYSVPVSTLFHLSGPWIEYNWYASGTIYRKPASLTDGLEFKTSAHSPSAFLDCLSLDGMRFGHRTPREVVD